jgi:hypothetical protein
MPLKSDLMAASLPYEAASKLGFDTPQTVTAAGTTQATATPLNCNCATVSTPTISGGVIITETNSTTSLFNSGPNTLIVYPAVGVTILGLAVNQGLTVANQSGVTLVGAGTSMTFSISSN